MLLDILQCPAKTSPARLPPGLGGEAPSSAQLSLIFGARYKGSEQSSHSRTAKRTHGGVYANALPTASNRRHGRSHEPPRERDLWFHYLGCNLETLGGS